MKSNVATNQPGNETISNRYVLREKLGSGGMGEVFCAYDRLTNEIVALKRMLVSPEVMRFNSKNQTSDAAITLAREFRTLATLRHPHIISVLDYGFDGDGFPFFTMEYLPHAETILLAGKDANTARRVDLLFQLLRGLLYLHRRYLLHRDLKPPNVMVDSGQVKIIDFGLAIELDLTESVAGTITYIAPEVLQGDTQTPVSDLYAVGVIAYELFKQRYPFDTGQPVIELIDDIANTPPDCTGIPDGIRPIVEKLLAKEPAERYQTAQKVLDALNATLEQPIHIETIHTRESFLQSARFVGRVAEMRRLSDSLQQALIGNGSVCLIGGESGVGKSRLIEEFRSRAMVTGALVLSGQAMEDGGLPYQLWRDPLRRLLLNVDVTDLEVGILKEIVPDINQLLGREVSPAPALTPQAHHKRLVSTIVHIFGQYAHPIVLLLEDLQWAMESLAPLQQLAHTMDSLPLMIVGSYRNDERPDLPQLLPGAERIALGRLDKRTLAQLSSSMLGYAGKREGFVDFLNKETEGNIFFVVEVIRALAEMAGSLEDVGQMTLPDRVISGGMQQVIQRRLEQVPDWAYAGLQVASIVGRQLDLSVLQALMPVYFAQHGYEGQPGDDVDLKPWLLTCAETAILTVLDGQWRFSHDKLRETLISNMATDLHQRMHRDVALALERIYPDDFAYAARLMHHWHHAENLRKEKYYAFHSGQQLVRMGAIAEAIAHIERSRQIAVDLDDLPDERIFIALGNAHRLYSEYERAATYFREALRQSNENLSEQIRAWIGLSWTQQNQGFDRESLESAEKAEHLLRTAGTLDKALLAEGLYHKGWALYRLGKTGTAQTIAQEGLALSEAANALQQKAQHLNLLSIVHCYALSEYQAAKAYQHEALTLHRQIGDKHGEGIVLNNLGETERLLANYGRAAALYQEAIEIADNIGDRDGAMAYRSNLGGALLGAGQVSAAIQELVAVIESAPSDWYVLPDSYCFLAEAYLHHENYPEALATLQKALALPEPFMESVGHMWRILGNVLARVPPSSDMVADVGLTSEACYARSLEVFEGEALNRERAFTLRDWSQYDVFQGNPEAALEKWREARAIFHSLGLSRLVQQLDHIKPEV